MKKNPPHHKQNQREREEAFQKGLEAALAGKPVIPGYIKPNVMDSWLAGWKKGERKK